MTRIHFHANGDANSYALIDQDANKWLMTVLVNGEHTTPRQAEILERMAACWNACQNIETSVLKEHALGVITAEHSQTRNELLAALKGMVDRFSNRSTDQEDQPKTFGCHHMAETCSMCEGLVTGWKAVQAARAAIAKVS